MSQLLSLDSHGHENAANIECYNLLTPPDEKLILEAAKFNRLGVCCIALGLVFAIAAVAAGVLIGKYISLTDGLIAGGSGIGATLLVIGVAVWLNKKENAVDKKILDGQIEETTKVYEQVADFYQEMYRNRRKYFKERFRQRLIFDAKYTYQRNLESAIIQCNREYEEGVFEFKNKMQKKISDIQLDAALAQSFQSLPELQVPWKRCQEAAKKFLSIKEMKQQKTIEEAIGLCFAIDASSGEPVVRVRRLSGPASP